MENTHETYMRAALEQSLLGKKTGNGPIGCVIVKDGEVVAAGHNEEGIRKDPTAHAEMVTIQRLCQQIKNKNLSGYTL